MPARRLGLIPRLRLTPQHRRDWRRALARYRRLLVAGLTAGATAAALHVLAPAAAATVAVVVAARDLPAGHTLTDGDLRRADWPAPLVPRGGAGRPLGRTLASPLRAGEPVTDVRLTGPSLLAGQPAGTRAVTVRVRDSVAVTVLRPGDRVDVLSAGPSDLILAAERTGPATTADVVAQDALVLMTPAAGAAGPEAATGGGLGALTGGGGPPRSDGNLPDGVLVVAVDGRAAQRLAAAASSQSLTVTIRAPG